MGKAKWPAWYLIMRMEATAKRVEAQSVPVVRDSSIRNPLAFEKAWRGRVDTE